MQSPADSIMEAINHRLHSPVNGLLYQRALCLSRHQLPHHTHKPIILRISPEPRQVLQREVIFTCERVQLIVDPVERGPQKVHCDMVNEKQICGVTPPGEGSQTFDKIQL